jgi:hypothetical protein
MMTGAATCWQTESRGAGRQWFNAVDTENENSKRIRKMNQLEQEVQEFDKLHAGQDGSVKTQDDVWHLYSDGARRGAISFAELGPEFASPPTKPKELYAWQKTFWEIRLQNLVTEFEDLKGMARTSAGDGSKFSERLEQLKTLQSKIRSARMKLTHLNILVKGYCQRDVERAWEVWQQFSEAAGEESRASAKLQAAMLSKSGSGLLEKLKRNLDQAKKQSQRAMERWNGFTPVEARAIVSEELDQQRRMERESELSKIEV